MCSSCLVVIVGGLLWKLNIIYGIGWATIFTLTSSLMIYYWSVVKRAYTEKGMSFIHDNEDPTYELVEHK